MPSFSAQMVMPAVYNVSEKEMKKKDYGSILSKADSYGGLYRCRKAGYSLSRIL